MSGPQGRRASQAWWLCGCLLDMEQTWDATMPMKVGRIPYLECEPLYFDMARRGIAMSAMVPSQLAAAAAAGEIDAGPVPLVDCFRLADRFQPVSGFCLACAKRAGNIFLYAKQPIEQLTGARIGITDETSTALRLLQVLLGLPEPVYLHHRLIVDADGHKLSKSTQATGLRELRAEGVTPLEIRRMVGLGV